MIWHPNCIDSFAITYICTAIFPHKHIAFYFIFQYFLLTDFLIRSRSHFRFGRKDSSNVALSLRNLSRYTTYDWQWWRWRTSERETERKPKPTKRKKHSNENPIQTLMPICCECLLLSYIDVYTYMSRIFLHTPKTQQTVQISSIRQLYVDNIWNLKN